MEVVNARSALLSNFEVLTLLRELESDHLAQAKTALRVKKEDEEAGRPLSNYISSDQVCENLRTVEVEAIQYLSADYQPIPSQNEVGIAKMVRDLAPYELTKAEKLQIVNLAPTEAVELYVVVEEIEDRLGERMEEVLEIVQASLTPSATPAEAVEHQTPTSDSAGAALAYPSSDPLFFAEEQWDNDAADMMFDDHGEGAGVEGDLDMEDD